MNASSEQFEPLQQQDDWQSHELQRINALRRAHNGDMDSVQLQELKDVLENDFRNTFDRFSDAINRTEDPDLERAQIGYMLRFAKMLSTGGFSEDAAELLQRILAANTHPEKPRSLLIPTA